MACQYVVLPFIQVLTSNYEKLLIQNPLKISNKT